MGGRGQANASRCPQQGLRPLFRKARARRAARGDAKRASRRSIGGVHTYSMQRAAEVRAMFGSNRVAGRTMRRGLRVSMRASGCCLSQRRACLRCDAGTGPAPDTHRWYGRRGCAATSGVIQTRASPRSGQGDRCVPVRSCGETHLRCVARSRRRLIRRQRSVCYMGGRQVLSDRRGGAHCLRARTAVWTAGPRPARRCSTPAAWRCCCPRRVRHLSTCRSPCSAAPG